MKVNGINAEFSKIGKVSIQFELNNSAKVMETITKKLSKRMKNKIQMENKRRESDNFLWNQLDRQEIEVTRKLPKREEKVEVKLYHF